MKTAKTPGKVMPAKTMILRVHCGEATAGKLSYRLSTAISGMPVVQSGQTGKWYSLDWQDIIDMAVKAGIDKP